MKPSSQIIITLLLTIFCTIVQAQTPYISALSHRNAAPGDTITVSGVNFSTNASNWEVWFGGGKGNVVSSTSSLLEVVVPMNATSNNISVLNISTNQVAYSNDIFYLSFGGESGEFREELLDDIEIQPTGGTLVQDFCVCDFDRDGKIDVATSHDQVDLGSSSSETTLAVMKNNSTQSTIDLSDVTELNLGLTTKNIDCGDLNGDGYPDIVVSSAGTSDRVLVLENPNDGTMNFNNNLSLIIPKVDPNDDNSDRRNPGKLIISDLNKDGKPEIIVVMTSEGSVDVFENTSTGSLSFRQEPIRFQFGDASRMSGLDVKDLNNDGLPDIFATQDNSGGLFVLQNESFDDDINFKQSVTFSTGNSGRNLKHIKSGDFNLDGFNDVAIVNSRASSLTSNIVVLYNSTIENGDPINFDDEATGIEVYGGIRSPWGIEVGDIEGDGDLDIMVTTNGGDNSSPLHIFENTNASGSGEVFSEVISTNKASKRSKAGKFVDINNDAKPDFVLNYNSKESTAGEVGVLLNKNCIVPSVSAPLELSICNGEDILLTANPNPAGYTYSWYNGGSSTPSLASSIETEFSVSFQGSYSLIIENGSLCLNPSTAIEATLDTYAFTDPVINPVPSSICSGQDITIDVDANESDVTYEWTGPNGFSSNSEDILFENITSESAGTYTLVTTERSRSCISNPVSVTISVASIPKPLISTPNGLNICDDGVSSLDILSNDLSNFGTYMLSFTRLFLFPLFLFRV